MNSTVSLSNNCFEERFKTGSFTISTYLGRLILRTHHENDTENLTLIYSDAISRKYLQFLQPPKGWGDDAIRNRDKIWTQYDFLDRVKAQTETRKYGNSCVFNIILIEPNSNNGHDRCIGTTGFVTINGHIAYLGIISEKYTMRMGYATEALHASIVFAFERLGVTCIIMETDENNQEMRGWCENLAGLILNSKKTVEVNGYTFVQYQYKFDLDYWYNSVKGRLETKMNNINKDKKFLIKPIDVL